LPGGVVLLATLLLLILTGIVAGVGLRGPSDPDPARELTAFTGGDPDRGRETIRQNGCPTCHIISGISEAKGLIGPLLDHFASRAYIGGVVPNTPENLVAWIRNAPGIDPMTAMPASGISEAEARDAAAYLYTLH
jgi:mono/diheme cytochrome c family protein